MSNRSDYVLFGSFGGWNSGDEAILDSVELLLKLPPPKDSSGEVMVICHRLRDGIVEHYQRRGRRAVLAKDLRQIVSILRHRQLVVGGGQMITGDRSYKGLILLMLLTTLARWMGRPAVMVGIGVEGVHRSTVKWLCRRIVSNCLEVHCRDEYSREMLLDAGCKAKRLRLAADVVLSGVIVRPRPEPMNPTIAIGLHRTPLRTYTDTEEILRLTLSLLEAFTEHDIIFVSNDCRDGFDQTMLKELQSKLDHPRIRFQLFEDADSIIATYATCKCVISVRMHPLILGLIHRVPVVGFARSNKVKQLAGRVGFELVDPTKNDPSEIIQKIREAMGRGAPPMDAIASLSCAQFDAMTELTTAKAK